MVEVIAGDTDTVDVGVGGKGVRVSIAVGGTEAGVVVGSTCAPAHPANDNVTKPRHTIVCSNR